MSELAVRLGQVRESISAACARLNRAEPTLIVVTKTHPVELVEEVYGLGEVHFGENRVQEGLPKANEFALRHPGSDVHWHLIGQLQSNKVKQALEFVDSVHSLDRESLLTELLKRTDERLNPLDVFIQVNLTEDPARGGIQPQDLLGFADQVATAPGLSLRGLMAVASLEAKPEKDFEMVAALSERLTSLHPTARGRSIGMSGDFLTALEYGATHLRVGSAITGNRSG